MAPSLPAQLRGQEEHDLQRVRGAIMQGSTVHEWLSPETLAPLGCDRATMCRVEPRELIQSTIAALRRDIRCRSDEKHLHISRLRPDQPQAEGLWRGVDAFSAESPL